MHEGLLLADDLSLSQFAPLVKRGDWAACRGLTIKLYPARISNLSDWATANELTINLTNTIERRNIKKCIG